MSITLFQGGDYSKNIYYQRDWAKALPSMPAGWMETGQHVAGLALPFIGILYQPAGRIISYTSTTLNSLSSLYCLYSAKAFSKQHVWNLVKNGAELIGTVAGLRIGLGLHTIMNLGENLLSFRNFKTLTWRQVGEKMVPVISNGLYLATLYNFSKKVSYAVMGVSLLFQVGLNAYKARQSARAMKTWRDIKVLDMAAHAALSLIFLSKASACFQQFIKIHQAAQKSYVPVRPASKHDKTHGGITDKGKKLAQTTHSAALEDISNRYDKDASTEKHTHETGKVMAEKLGLDPSQVIQDPNVMKIHQAAEKSFILMRPASKHDKTHGGITAKGKKLAQTILPAALEDISKRYGKDGIIIITSTEKHNYETGKVMAEKLGLDPSQVIQDPNMVERTKTGWLLIGDKKVRRVHPDYIHFNQELSEAEQWVTAPASKDPRSESQAASAARLSGAVLAHLEKAENNKMSVFVCGSTIIEDYVRSLRKSDTALQKLLKSCPPLLKDIDKRSLKDGDMVIVTMVPNENGDLKAQIAFLAWRKFAN
jgi:broad specificity phosphatase PhoE